MITLTREEAQQVLDALEKVTKQMLSVRDELAERGARPVMNPHHQTLWDSTFEAYVDHALPAAETLRARLSAPEPEPVASKHSGSIMTREQAVEHCRRRRPGIEPTEKHIAATIDTYSAFVGDLIPAAPAPPQREWQGLTDEDRQELAAKQYGWEGLCSAVEAKLREKNS